jgi:tetratricopeptide (TPR) repeat protein
LTWDHAEEADLKTLSEKVLSKIEGKNVFIGICTRRELAVEQTKLSRQLLSTSTLKASAHDFEWKTSDWLIQEIGLAIGRKMKLIIFLEEGVRAPGGLYGDLEYISFARSYPKDSFDKLLQMLTALSPIESSQVMAESKSAVSEEKPKDDASLDILEPKPAWTQEDYDNAVFHAIWRNNTEALENVNAVYEASPLSTGLALSVWRANEEYWRMVFDRNPNFDRLKTIAVEHPTNGKILFCLARGYAQYDDHLQAAKTFEKAAAHSEDEKDKIQYLGEAANEYARAGERRRAIELFEKIKGDAGENPKLSEIILYSVQQFAEIEKDDDYLVAVMERSVELQPTDNYSRFNLAYRHSEIENEDMALQHYTKISVASRSAMAWNNLGVSFGQFGMPGKGVQAFRKSEEMNGLWRWLILGSSFYLLALLMRLRVNATKHSRVRTITRTFHSC